jgi:sugar lactone lactonase YvrE
MTPQYSIHDSAARGRIRVQSTRLHATKRPALVRSMRSGALCVLVGLGTSILVAPIGASAAPFGPGPFTPGSVVVSQGGTIFGGTNVGTGVELNGDVDVYRPNANGDVAPEASFTEGSYGPTTMAFDPSGDLWVANENTSDLFQITKAELAAGPWGDREGMPRVTIFAESGALANPFGMAFDQSGDLWVVSNAWSRVYEYTESQLATSGAPTPVTTISDFPSSPLSDAFDAAGDLWVSTDTSVVEFSEAELATASPAPTVTISTSGGAQLIFDSSGDLWIVTGGGPYCFGTPCSNEVLEFTKEQLSASGSPTPTVTIGSTKAGPTGSIYGPYSLAFTSFGNLWVENFDNNTTVEFGKDQLSTSGSPTPLRTVVGPNTGMNFPSYVLIAP